MVTSAIRPRPPFRSHPAPARDMNTLEYSGAWTGGWSLPRMPALR